MKHRIHRDQEKRMAETSPGRQRLRHPEVEKNAGLAAAARIGG